MKPSFKIKCPFCGNLFEKQRFICHLTKAHDLKKSEQIKLYCHMVFGEKETEEFVEAYKKGEICAYDLTKMGWDYQHIVDYIKELGLKRSSSEERHTTRYKEKYTSSIQKKYGIEVTNVSQAKSVQKKKERTFAKTYGSYDEYCRFAREKMMEGCKKKWRTDSEYREKMSEQMRGDKNIARRKEIAEKLANTQRQRFAKMSVSEKRQIISKARKTFVESLKGKEKPRDSEIERRVRNALVTLGEVFDHNKRMLGYNFDIVLEGIMAIVEINGDYHHANPNKYNDETVMFRNGCKVVTAKQIRERDERKYRKARENGYDVYIVWESDIRKCFNEQELISLLKAKLKFIN